MRPNKTNFGLSFGDFCRVKREEERRREEEEKLSFAVAKPLFTAWKCCVLFRFVFPLFQRLVYWTNKDPISV